MLAKTASVLVKAAEAVEVVEVVAVGVHSMGINKALQFGEVMQVAALQHHVVVMHHLDEEELV